VDFVEPVWQKLQQFNPGANYQREDIKNTLRDLTKRGIIPNITLLPDQKNISPISAESNEYKLLIARCCKVYVDLIVEPHFGKRRRISKSEKEFIVELEDEIYRLENGDAMFGY
jgi:hypothetical protein